MTTAAIRGYREAQLHPAVTLPISSRVRGRTRRVLEARASATFAVSLLLD